MATGDVIGGFIDDTAAVARRDRLDLGGLLFVLIDRKDAREAVGAILV